MTLSETARGLSVNDPLRQQLLVAEARRQALWGGGDFIEMGVYRGGTALLLAEVLRAQHSSARLHLLDAWQGMPEPSAEDGRPWIGAGYFADASAAAVAETLAQHGLLGHCELYPGWFKDTLPALRGPFALAHVDCDYFEPVLFCLRHVLPRMSRYGAVVVDDHGEPGAANFPGVARAVALAIAGTDWQMLPLGGQRDQSVILLRDPETPYLLTLI